ncbi:ABC transporter permease subunit [Anaerocolumna sedimenticola]|uniref:ABC transporter permease subunit n=1 Tax=Anaerocolumna sedimenticola TaxID=2696063 RepID=A0A6P1TN73_9FIRM|nr:sugar ABC transporter permease [Anaerocolumna sedimenticola]QHQ60798.1 ABC transporter permease subunit [Anaerocolumna sedimenticola]
MRAVNASKKGILAEEAKKSVLLIPAVIMLAVFFVLPILLTVYYSFTNLALTGENAKTLDFIGLENYGKLFKDPSVQISILNTLIFLIGSLIGQQVLGFTLAILMKNKNKIFRSFAGPCILAGWVMPEIVVALCCSTFFMDSGTLNAILQSIHLKPVEWLYKFPMLTIVLSNIWHGTAFSMMNFQSALDGVPSDIEDAAKVDGTGRFQKLICIILPNIKNTIATNTMLNTLSTLGVFGLIYTMTGGGPGTKTLTLPIFMYKQAFVSYQLGYGTAISMILLVIGIIFSVAYTRLTKE